MVEGCTTCRVGLLGLGGLAGGAGAVVVLGIQRVHHHVNQVSGVTLV